MNTCVRLHLFRLAFCKVPLFMTARDRDEVGKPNHAAHSTLPNKYTAVYNVKFSGLQS